MKKIKHIINSIVWTLITIHAVIFILLRIPTIQNLLGSETASLLEKELGTKVKVGRIDLGFLNRIIIDNVQLYDQQNKLMFSATRLSAKPSLTELFNGRIAITSAQLFGMKANLTQANAEAKPNFQYIIDCLSSTDETENTPLDLRISSLIIRHGSINFDRKDIAPEYGKLSPYHLHANNISAHIVLNRLTDDSLNLNIKRLSLKESSGLQLKKLSLKVIANKQGATVSDFTLELPATELVANEVKATYRFKNEQFDPLSIKFNGKINESRITPSDLSCFLQELKDFKNHIFIRSSFAGTNNSIHISTLNIGSAKKSISLTASGSVNQWDNNPQWTASIQNLHLSAEGIEFVASNMGKRFNLPAEVVRLGNINYQGTIGGNTHDLTAKGILKTDAGQVTLSFGKHEHQFSGQVETTSFDLGQLLDDKMLGTLATRVNVKGAFTKEQSGLPNMTIKGNVSQLEYNSYIYNDITIDGVYNNKAFDGLFQINDPNATITLNGKLDVSEQTPQAKLIANIEKLDPEKLHLSDKWPNTKFRFNIDADFTGADINSGNGTLAVTDFVMEQANTQIQSDDSTLVNSEQPIYEMRSLFIEAQNNRELHLLTLNSDFANLRLLGRFDYQTLIKSITNLIADKIPTLPGLPAMTSEHHNNFTIKGSVTRSDWMKALLNVPLEIESPLNIDATINDNQHSIDLNVDIPSFTYSGDKYRNANISIKTPNDTLLTVVHVDRLQSDGNNFSWDIASHAADNRLSVLLSFNDHHGHPFMGSLNAETQFQKNAEGEATAHINIRPSTISVSDTVWTVRPCQIIYGKNSLDVDNFLITSNDDQHISIHGKGTRNQNDSLTLDLRNVNVRYLLDLVNFHSVDFDGRATGRAYVSGLFNKPEANADLYVRDFRFQSGRMGILTVNAHLDNTTEQINLDALAADEDGRETLVKGFVSPWRNEIDLAIGARGTRGEFLESFCGSFMRNVDMNIVGDLRLHGPLDAINLTGAARATGSLAIKPLNTTYHMQDLAIRLIPNEILFENDTISDRNGNIGIINGALHHKNLTRLTYDIGVEARNLLSYDYPNFGDGTICGTVCATGECNIRGRSGEVVIDINVTPNNGTVFSYNAASPDALRSQEFIHWVQSSQKAISDSIANEQLQAETKHFPTLLSLPEDIPTDIRMNLLINATPDATLRVVMDNETGDCIALNGSGVLRATFYNKGTFDMFGTYNVDHGSYKMTIQNVIKKDFDFVRGGSIVFGGDPYNAVLNLQAQYAVNGVSLSDLQIGRSFASNNIRVNCLMNISGTPYSPHIDFDLDMPTVDSNAKQMVFSLINSEEEMNQQVLYLLAVGRFYAPSNNNAAAEGENQQSQTSLAMQSILSGALSQQLSNIIGSMANSSKWSVGANISTGAEGFYNAEYEGLLTGRLLNNRLLINGEIGYRDNVNTPDNSSFIGDFDVRYLLRPSGSLAVKVYNQTNDRYFTRNSLTTQGLGIIMKKDFNGFHDLFGLKKKNRKKVTKPSNKKQKAP
ncbi:MAG: translocation/assembly module TamB [Prevotella sp.]|nr:translocation/assembly module TamB [Prevotella sp.]